MGLLICTVSPPPAGSEAISLNLFRRLCHAANVLLQQCEDGPWLITIISARRHRRKGGARVRATAGV